MVLLSSDWRRRLTLALLAAAWGLASARAQDAEKKPGLAAPAPVSTAVSNAAEPLPGQGKFELFEEELFKPLAPFGPRKAIDRVMNPVFRPRLMSPDNQKEQDLMERQRNWVFTDLNDLHEMSKPEDGLLDFMPGLKPVKEALKKLPPMERFYQEMGKGQGGDSNLISEMLGAAMGLKGPNATNAFNPIVLLLGGSNDFMKGMLVPADSDRPDKVPPGFGFGTDPLPTPEVAAREQERKRRTEEFKRLVDPSLPALPPPNTHIPSAMELLLRPASAAAAPTSGSLPGGLAGLPGPAAASSPGAMTPAFGMPGSAGSTLTPVLPGNPYATAQPANATPKPVNVTPTRPPDTLDNYPKRKF